MAEVLDTFDLSETVTGLLHEQDGLARAMTRQIAALRLDPNEEHVLFSLLDAQARCRDLAMQEAARLIRAR